MRRTVKQYVFYDVILHDNVDPVLLSKNQKKKVRKLLSSDFSMFR